MLGQPETCQSCGYLEAQNPGRGLTYEVDATRRANGYLAEHHTLHCWRELVNLSGETEEVRVQIVQHGDFTGAVPNDRPLFAAHRAVLERHRECGGWYPWRPNLSPRDHYEEQRTLQLEELRRAHELKIAELQAESDKRTQQLMEAQHDILLVQTSIAEATRQVAEATQRDYQRSDAQNTKHNRWFLVLATTGIILALATLILPNGLPWFSDRFEDDGPQPVTDVGRTPSP